MLRPISKNKYTLKELIYPERKYYVLPISKKIFTKMSDEEVEKCMKKLRKHWKT
jgi:hypothetical protein